MLVNLKQYLNILVEEILEHKKLGESLFDQNDQKEVSSYIPISSMTLTMYNSAAWLLAGGYYNNTCNIYELINKELPLVINLDDPLLDTKLNKLTIIAYYNYIRKEIKMVVSDKNITIRRFIEIIYRLKTHRSHHNSVKIKLRNIYQEDDDELTMCANFDSQI